MRLRRATREEVAKLRSIADFQFGYPVGDHLIPDDVIVGVSPATRRIREVYGPEGLLAVLRASDYLYSLSLLGGERVRRATNPPRLRVVVDPKRIRLKSVWTEAVLRVDEYLKVGDEVLVVDESDRLLGVGRLRLPPADILAGCVGEAVRLRKLRAAEEG